VGCSAGEGHLGSVSAEAEDWVAKSLAAVLKPYARSRGTFVIVLKDFTASDRGALQKLVDEGYARVPSMPMTKLELRYGSFEEYVTTLGAATRKNLRRKFRGAESDEPIVLEVMTNISPLVDEIYPLYLQVHERSRQKFERLTKEYFCAIGQRLPDRARYFVWRRNEKIVAFSLCLVHAGTIYDECLGLDYAVAYDLHLYYYTFRDVMRWALEQGLQTYCSTPLGYDPKLHLDFELVPLDLYAMHTSRWLNPLFQRALDFLQPVPHDPVLRKYRNVHEL